MQSRNLLKRFVKDYNLPIQVFEEEYFDYFMNLYDSLYGCKKLYDVFCTYVEQFENEDLFFDNQSKLIKEISDKILNNDNYKTFTSFNIDDYKPLIKVSQNNIYNNNNAGKKLFSVDLKKANFTSLLYFNPSLVDNCSTYEEFMKQFTDSNYIISSKNFRQVVFGQLNVKRQQAIQKYIISIFASKLIEIIGEERIMSASSDEIVIDIDDVFNEQLVEQLTKIVDDIAKSLNVQVNVSVFMLKQLSNPSKFGYVKEHANGEIEFKAGSKLFFAQAFKEYFNLPLNENDFVFYYDGELAKFI